MVLKDRCSMSKKERGWPVATHMAMGLSTGEPWLTTDRYLRQSSTPSTTKEVNLPEFGAPRILEVQLPHVLHPGSSWKRSGHPGRPLFSLALPERERNCKCHLAASEFGDPSISIPSTPFPAGPRGRWSHPYPVHLGGLPTEGVENSWTEGVGG